jgi:hypothetical protein
VGSADGLGVSRRLAPTFASLPLHLRHERGVKLSAMGEGRLDADAMRAELAAEGLSPEQVEAALLALSATGPIVYHPARAGGRANTLRACREIVERYPLRTSTVHPDGTETHVWSAA